MVATATCSDVNFELVEETNEITAISGSSTSFTETEHCPNDERIITIDLLGAYEVASIDDAGVITDLYTGNLGTDLGLTSVQGQSATMTYDTNTGRLIVTFKDTSVTQWKVVVGAVGVSSIVWGTPVNLGTTYGMTAPDTLYDPSSARVVIQYGRTTNGYTDIKLGTIVGGGTNSASLSSSIQVGTNIAGTFKDGNNRLAMDTTNDFLVSLFGESSDPQLRVGDIDPGDDTIDWGTQHEIHTSAIGDFYGIAYDPITQRVMFAWDNATSGDGEYAVFSISGAKAVTEEIASTLLQNNTVDEGSIRYDSFAQEFVITLHHSNTTGIARAAKITTGSPDTVAFGADAEWRTADDANSMSTKAVSTSGIATGGVRVIVAYADISTFIFTLQNIGSCNLENILAAQKDARFTTNRLDKGKNIRYNG